MANFIIIVNLCAAHQSSNINTQRNESCDGHVTSSCSGLHIHTRYILVIIRLHVYVQIHTNEDREIISNNNYNVHVHVDKLKYMDNVRTCIHVVPLIPFPH